MTNRTSYARPTSVTLLRFDPLPNLPASISPTERLFQFVKAVALVASTSPSPNKWRADLSDSQTHRKSYKATDQPVPLGQSVSDTVLRKPQMFSFSGIISDTPLIPWTGISLDLPFTSGEALGIPGTGSWMLDQIRQLDEFAERKEPLFVATSIRAYQSMLIEDYTIKQDTDSGGSVSVDLTLKEIRFTTEVRARPIPESLIAQLGSEPIEVSTPSGEFLN